MQHIFGLYFQNPEFFTQEIVKNKIVVLVFDKSLQFLLKGRHSILNGKVQFFSVHFSVFCFSICLFLYFIWFSSKKNSLLFLSNCILHYISHNQLDEKIKTKLYMLTSLPSTEKAGKWRLSVCMMVVLFRSHSFNTASFNIINITHESGFYPDPEPTRIRL